MKAKWNYQVIAENDDTVMEEGNHYFPAGSVYKEYLRSFDTHTVCHWKGIAFNIEVDGKTNKVAACYYTEPKEAAKEIKRCLVLGVASLSKSERFKPSLDHRSPVMIDVQHLTKHYQNTIAVNDVSFRVEEGQTLVLLGTSGSGKTTTLRMLNRLVEPTSGTITINGEDILSQTPERLRRRMGYVLQGYGLFPHYTVAENIAIVPRLSAWPEEKIKQRVNSLLQKLHLLPEEYQDMYPANLSGGQMQRVGLARALAANPPILLMDEPFGALDPLTRMAIRNEFKELDELKQKTIIMVTHDVQEAFALGNIIGLMDKGTLQQIGTPAELLFQPANAFVRNFFQYQRLQLEWQAITLKNVWAFLPDAAGTASASLKSSQTVWEALEQLSKSTYAVIAHDEKSETAKEITFFYLQSAFQQLKRGV